MPFLGKNMLRFWEEQAPFLGQTGSVFLGKNGSICGEIGLVFGLAWDKAQVSLF